MRTEIDTMAYTRLPRSLTELITLGRTPKRRAGDILAYFEHSYTTGGHSQAVNGRLEFLRGSAPGLAKPHPLHHPSTPGTGGFKHQLHPPIIKSQVPEPPVFQHRIEIPKCLT